MAKKLKKCPATPRQARKDGYAAKKVSVGRRGEKKWAMIKQKGQWSFEKVSSTTVSGSHIICYYNPETGNWDDCHTI